MIRYVNEGNILLMELSAMRMVVIVQVLWEKELHYNLN